jgi:ubiquinone/menaquinone biosynthesis C-methylase UbiE
VCLLKYVPPGSTILIVGGGTGWILEELSKQYNTGLIIDYVESSAQMVALSKKRWYGDNAVHFINLPIESFTAGHSYDIIITPFVFDNFNPDKAGQVFKNLHRELKTKGIWLYADFVYNENEGRLWQKLLLKTMYLFFSLTSNIETSELENMERCFDNRYQKIFESWFYARFIRSQAYQKL